MDPDACRNCGHSGKHVDFLDHRCAIHERDDAERDKLQADAALARARSLCEASLALMKRQMQELEDANAAIDALARALAAAEDRRERLRRDLGAHGDACLAARSNFEAAEEMAIAAAGRYFEAGRAVTALEEREQHSETSLRDGAFPAAGDDGEEGDDEDRGRWKRSNERFCKWLRQSEAQRQIMKSSWTKVRVAERLAGESNGAGSADEEEAERRNRVREWAAARRSDVPPEEEATMVTEEAESEPAPVVAVPPTPAATRSGAARKAAGARTRGRGAAAAAAAAAAPASPAKTFAAATRTRRVESQTRSEPARPTARVKREDGGGAAATKQKETSVERPARTTRAARTAKTTAAAGRPQRVTRRRSRVQPRWK